VCAAIAGASSQSSVFAVFPRARLSPQSHVGDISPARFHCRAGKAPGIVPLKQEGEGSCFCGARKMIKLQTEQWFKANFCWLSTLLCYRVHLQCGIVRLLS